ncbi:alkaline phosphatase [Parvularcula marina]|uniref:Alkaline phosphatase n=1 Tax=Parvularcula marina TaxID=2292771 RepID=A0A371R8I2_9PROT|nr:alkaline phosphatase [Parvularcula marina]RFB01754.1 alkaline phosphatase [Parvularcula marina]
MLSLLMSAALLAQPATVEPVDWEKMGEETLAAAKAQVPNNGRAKNVILFIADGMDITTVTAARILAGQKLGGPGEDHVLAMDSLPWAGLSKTYNTNAQTPDSAGTATAMMSGRKTKSGVINVDQTVPRGDCEAGKAKPLSTIMKDADAVGARIGVISTARITHATPAAVYASAANRNWESDTDLPKDANCMDIASQLIIAGARYRLDVALGGGREKFLPKSVTDPEYDDETGEREDDRDLTAEWTALAKDNRFVWNREGFEALDPEADGQVLGLFEPSHMQYSADLNEDSAGEPTLAKMTGFAIDKLSRGDEGFFLMVEGGRVDHAHHGGNAARALEDVGAFDAAIATALDKTNAEDTLIIVTADHGHTLVFQGYPQRGNPILGLVKSVTSAGEPATTLSPAADGKPYTTLAYGNGPGSPFAGSSSEGPTERPFVSDEEAQSIDYRQQSIIPSYSETHGGQDVAIFASGPQAHLLSGVVEQSFIYYVMREALTAEE